MHIFRKLTLIQTQIREKVSNLSIFWEVGATTAEN